MKDTLYQIIEKSTAHRKSRNSVKNLIVEKPELLSELLQIAFNQKDKNHIKAFWIFELVCEEKMKIFIPHIDLFFKSIHIISNESALRSITKICLLVTKNKKIITSNFQEKKIIEYCFVCLISIDKTANAAYSMRTLFNLSIKHNWIKEELATLLSRNISNKTPGYCFAVKDILKKLTP